MTQLPSLELTSPMPGFPTHRHFALLELHEGSLLTSMQSLDDPHLRFLVAPPLQLFPDYAPEIDDDAVAELGIESTDEVLLLVVIRPGKSLADSTANLLAPVLVNTRTHKAKQVILDDPAFDVAVPLIAA